MRFDYSLDYEEREAARFAGYTWQAYQALPGAPRWSANDESKCDVLVFYRASRMIEALQYEDAKR